MTQPPFITFNDLLVLLLVGVCAALPMFLSPEGALLVGGFLTLSLMAYLVFEDPRTVLLALESMEVGQLPPVDPLEELERLARADELAAPDDGWLVPDVEYRPGEAAATTPYGLLIVTSWLGSLSYSLNGGAITREAAIAMTHDLIPTYWTLNAVLSGDEQTPAVRELRPT